MSPVSTQRTLLVEYDLSKPGQSYEELIDGIKSFETWGHHLKSAWMVKTSLSTVVVRDKLRSFIDRNDKLMVIDVTGDAAAWCGMSDEVSSWIKSTM